MYFQDFGWPVSQKKAQSRKYRDGKSLTCCFLSQSFSILPIEKQRRWWCKYNWSVSAWACDHRLRSGCGRHDGASVGLCVAGNQGGGNHHRHGQQQQYVEFLLFFHFHFHTFEFDLYAAFHFPFIYFLLFCSLSKPCIRQLYFSVLPPRASTDQC